MFIIFSYQGVEGIQNKKQHSIIGSAVFVKLDLLVVLFFPYIILHIQAWLHFFQVFVLNFVVNFNTI